MNGQINIGVKGFLGATRKVDVKPPRKRKEIEYKIVQHDRFYNLEIYLETQYLHGIDFITYYVIENVNSLFIVFEEAASEIIEKAKDYEGIIKNLKFAFEKEENAIKFFEEVIEPRLLLIKLSGKKIP